MRDVRRRRRSYDFTMLPFTREPQRAPSIPAGNIGPKVFNYLAAEGAERVSEDAMNELALAVRARLGASDHGGVQDE